MNSEIINDKIFLDKLQKGLEYLLEIECVPVEYLDWYISQISFLREKNKLNGWIYNDNDFIIKEDGSIFYTNNGD